MAFTQITNLPSRGDPSTFADYADAIWPQLKTVINEMNASSVTDLSRAVNEIDGASITDLDDCTPDLGVTFGLATFVGVSNVPADWTGATTSWVLKVNAGSNADNFTQTLYRLGNGAVAERMYAFGSFGDWVIRTPEAGSNANGSYVKYEDGTLICVSGWLTTTAVTTAAGAGYRSDDVTWTYPATFSAAPAVVAQSQNSARWPNPEQPTASNVKIRQFSFSSFTGGESVRAIAVGTWA